MEGIIYCACSRSGSYFNEAPNQPLEEQTVALTLEPTSDGREMLISEVGHRNYDSTYTISLRCPTCGASRRFMIRAI